MGNCLRLWSKQDLNHVNLEVLFEETYFDFVETKSRMILSVWSLMNDQLRVCRSIFWIPLCLDYVMRGLIEPLLTPFD